MTHPAHDARNILFLCTGNSARSILGEAVATLESKGRLIGWSAGSTPTGRVHPIAAELVTRLGYPQHKLRSKRWDEFAAADAPQMDIIITVCDNAAGEVCPIWPGHPATAHWGFPDPAAVQASEAAQRQAFAEVLQGLTQRVRMLLALIEKNPEKFQNKQELSDDLRTIAKTADGSADRRSN